MFVGEKKKKKRQFLSAIPCRTYLSNPNTKIVTSQHFGDYPKWGQPRRDCPPRVRWPPYWEERRKLLLGLTHFCREVQKFWVITLALLYQLKGPKSQKRAVYHLCWLGKIGFLMGRYFPRTPLQIPVQGAGGECQVIRAKHLHGIIVDGTT